MNEVVQVSASAPSNIALIKYMGKIDTLSNKPTNTSFSYTLDKLRTFVRITALQDTSSVDTWSPLVGEGLMPIQLSEKGKNKFLSFFSTLKKEFKLDGSYHIESANNFPSDCGLASSASSFAALTLATHELYLKKNSRQLSYTSKELSRLSQKGSGSSCRSFFSPWALWYEIGAESTPLPYNELHHMVILCDESIKSVSSSEAHVRVLTSDLFKGRVERATERLQCMLSSLRQKNWVQACHLSWNEFWDMHVLFHTSQPSFMYMNAQSLSALSQLNQIRLKHPEIMVTMDAGSNIHILLRPEDTEIYKNLINDFKSTFNLWTDSGYIRHG